VRNSRRKERREMRNVRHRRRKKRREMRNVRDGWKNKRRVEGSSEKKRSESERRPR